MIVTVTPNPSLDRTLHLPHLTLGGVNRATATMVEPSGKGVNVALALHGVGVGVCAVLPTGAEDDMGARLTDAGLRVVAVPIAGRIRSNLSLVEADGRSTKVNEPGPHLTDAEADALCAAALSVGAPDDWVLWAGSLPAGFTPARLAGAVASARTAGRRVALDASGTALRTVLENPRDGLPHLVKPNADELAEVVGATLRTVGDVTAAAHALLARGVRTVLVSLGGDGAVLVDAALPTPLYGTAAPSRVVNTVGAGDAFLAGFLASPHGGADGLANALRFGAAAVEQAGTLLGTLDPHRPVHVGPARADTPLS
ncbi:1-phosphofructokinase [Mycolicibacterium madagascariense]|uniref:1-phosphofructokinase n=1 Tax=Mycolicibacterium madagascariense TaxID=212765 RepID=A0A7I7XBU4_9MYCO|nr:1-phosphofructokinase family hexose kinase [Mycolicibacterium madagascariense]MCV7011414.1 1-phosphofructokinase family hexose kinase [Mycolicibacterium madagascariense]BBZ26795.1 1-phosphofructokinase [Mycolicibacterium madagascariense]